MSRSRPAGHIVESIAQAVQSTHGDFPAHYATPYFDGAPFVGPSNSGGPVKDRVTLAMVGTKGPAIRGRW